MTKKEQLQAIKAALQQQQAVMNTTNLGGELWFDIVGRSVDNTEIADSVLADTINAIISAIDAIIDLLD